MSGLLRARPPTPAEFFEHLGPGRLAQLETATIDMASGYIKALEQQTPHVKTVFPRFHVQCLASNALDEVRRAMWRELKGTDEGQAIKAVGMPCSRTRGT